MNHSGKIITNWKCQKFTFNLLKNTQTANTILKLINNWSIFHIIHFYILPVEIQILKF